MLGSNGQVTKSGNTDQLAAPAPSGRRPRRALSGRFTAGHVVPLLAAVAAAVLVLAATRERAATELVALASRDIPPGAAVTSADLRWVPVRASEGAVASGLLQPQTLESGWVSRVAIASGSPVATGELRRGSPLGSGLGSMSLEVPVALADGGALAPGDRVDVISTASGQATYVATDLSVLAVASSRSGGVFSGIGTGTYYVTVAVDRATALRLAAAMGQPSGIGTGIEIVKSTGEGR